jgi:hypothetical protein
VLADKPLVVIELDFIEVRKVLDEVIQIDSVYNFVLGMLMEKIVFF